MRLTVVLLVMAVVLLVVVVVLFVTKKVGGRPPNHPVTRAHTTGLVTQVNKPTSRQPRPNTRLTTVELNEKREL